MSRCKICGLRLLWLIFLAGVIVLFVYACSATNRFLAVNYADVVYTYNDYVDKWTSGGYARFMNLSASIYSSQTDVYARLKQNVGFPQAVPHYEDDDDIVIPQSYNTSLTIQYNMQRNASDPAIFQAYTSGYAQYKSLVIVTDYDNITLPFIPTSFGASFPATCGDNDNYRTCTCPFGVRHYKSCEFFMVLRGVCLVVSPLMSSPLLSSPLVSSPPLPSPAPSPSPWPRWQPAVSSLSGAGCHVAPSIMGYPIDVPSKASCFPSVVNGLSPFVYEAQESSYFAFQNFSISLRSSEDPWVYAMAATQGSFDFGNSGTDLYIESVGYWVGFGSLLLLCLALLTAACIPTLSQLELKISQLEGRLELVEPSPVTGSVVHPLLDSNLQEIHLLPELRNQAGEQLPRVEISLMLLRRMDAPAGIDPAEWRTFSAEEREVRIGDLLQGRPMMMQRYPARHQSMFLLCTDMRFTRLQLRCVQFIRALKLATCNVSLAAVVTKPVLRRATSFISAVFAIVALVLISVLRDGPSVTAVLGYTASCNTLTLNREMALQDALLLPGMDQVKLWVNVLTAGSALLLASGATIQAMQCLRGRTARVIRLFFVGCCIAGFVIQSAAGIWFHMGNIIDTVVSASCNSWNSKTVSYTCDECSDFFRP